MRSILTPDDLRKGDLVTPGWYPLELVEYSEEPVGKEAKNQGSVNCIFNFKVFDGEFKGVSPRTQYNEAALGYGKSLWAALKIPFDKVKGYELSTELFKSYAANKAKVKGYIRRGKSDRGKDFNELVEFMPIDATPGETAKT